MLTPLLDVLARTWPIRITEVGWRFGATGIVLNTLVTPLLGIFIAIAVASLLGHRPAVRVLSILCWVIAGLLAISVGMFMLDSLQVRGEVATQNRGQFTAPTTKAIILGIVSTIVVVWLGVSGFRASRGRR